MNAIPVVKLYAASNTLFNRTRIAAEKKIYNDSLEAQVQERTRSLVEANVAMEAFSYSVAHDLRAPLRSILGFTQIIQREYAEGFCTDLKAHVNHIEKSAKRMNVIIDDLIRIARYEKASLHPEPLDLSKLVSEVWDNIAFNTPNRAQLQLHDLPCVVADPSLIEQVLINLLCNAVKYSMKKEPPLVEVGHFKQHGQIVFYVKDNGAGFDMQYSAKLFNAFDRLHSVSEFEGTGVGLSLAKSIIERHGGSIWAEGSVDEGAIFYFTIPAIEEQKTLLNNTRVLTCQAQA